jgi:hypothetical protein
VSYRRHAAKPTAVLWMLVATADAGLVLANLGTVALLAIVSVAAVTVAGVGTWRYLRRDAASADVPATVAARMPHRRRV